MDIVSHNGIHIERIRCPTSIASKVYKFMETFMWRTTRQQFRDFVATVVVTRTNLKLIIR